MTTPCNNRTHEVNGVCQDCYRPNGVSSCCNAELRVSHGEGEWHPGRTSWYECMECGEPCDAIPDCYVPGLVATVSAGPTYCGEPTPPKTEGWEKEFDEGGTMGELWDFFDENDIDGNFQIHKIKSFIRNLLARERDAHREEKNALVKDWMAKVDEAVAAAKKEALEAIERDICGTCRTIPPLHRTSTQTLVNIIRKHLTPPSAT